MFTARAVLMLIQGAASASSLEGADVALPGAEARLGWGSGYSSGAWSLLHLRVTGGDMYTLELSTQTGTLRSGLQPLTATLTVSAGAGVREQRLWLPLFTKRPVKLTLSSDAGVSSATLQPLSANAIVTEPMDSPAAYLGKPRVTGILEPQSALTALAGGAVLINAVGLERLPSGSLGLGELRRASSKPQGQLAALEAIAASVARVAPPPPRQSEGLAWWCAAAFVVALGVYSAQRLEWRVAVWGAVLMLGVGVTGWAALQARSSAVSADAEQTVLIGAGGWGLRLQITNRFNATTARLSLPSGVQLLSPIDKHYTATATLIRAGAWSTLSYWSAPSAARVPLRIRGDVLENSASDTLSDIYVVGIGPLEPIQAASKRSFNGNKLSFKDLESSSYGSLLMHLPAGSAVARLGQKLVIALYEPRVTQ